MKTQHYISAGIEAPSPLSPELANLDFSQYVYAPPFLGAPPATYDITVTDYIGANAQLRRDIQTLKASLSETEEENAALLAQINKMKADEKEAEQLVADKLQSLLREVLAIEGRIRHIALEF